LNNQNSGQVLPLMTIILGLLAALGLALTHSLLNSEKQFTQDEKDFQRVFNRSLGYALILNAIAENNRNIASLIDKVSTLYFNATARALDLAASTPVWELRLPIPSPDNVYGFFDLTAANIRNELSLLKRTNDELSKSLPNALQSHLKSLNLQETLCLTRSSSSLHASCAIDIPFALAVAPHLRSIKDLSPFTERLGPTHGILLIESASEIFLSTITLPRDAAQNPNFQNPFVGKSLFLTHPVHCRARAHPHVKSNCLRTFPPSKESKSLSSFSSETSFRPQWSIRVEDVTAPL